MELNAQSIEAIVRKVISGLDPAEGEAVADEVDDKIPLEIGRAHV